MKIIFNKIKPIGTKPVVEDFNDILLNMTFNNLDDRSKDYENKIWNETSSTQLDLTFPRAFLHVPNKMDYDITFINNEYFMDVYNVIVNHTRYNNPSINNITVKGYDDLTKAFNNEDIKMTDTFNSFLNSNNFSEAAIDFYTSLYDIEFGKLLISDPNINYGGGDNFFVRTINVSDSKNFKYGLFKRIYIGEDNSIPVSVIPVPLWESTRSNELFINYDTNTGVLCTFYSMTKLQFLYTDLSITRSDIQVNANITGTSYIFVKPGLNLKEPKTLTLIQEGADGVSVSSAKLFLTIIPTSNLEDNNSSIE